MLVYSTTMVVMRFHSETLGVEESFRLLNRLSTQKYSLLVSMMGIVSLNVEVDKMIERHDSLNEIRCKYRCEPVMKEVSKHQFN
jgi:hypothetical protein